MNRVFQFSMTFTLIVCCLSGLTLGDEKEKKGKWGHLKGSILVDGKLPEIADEKINKDKSTCLKGKAPKDDNLIAGKNGELKDVFVMMYRKKSDPAPAIHPSYEAAKAKPVVMDNKDCRFSPHAIFVRTGQVLELKNSDDCGHNCHLHSFNNEFNLMVSAADKAEVKLKKADKFPSQMKCDIHPWMDALVLTRDEPYAAITGKDGSFTIMNIPEGTWKFQFWHVKGGYLTKIDIPKRKVGRKKGEFEVTIENGKTLDLGKLKVPASSLNK